ncbi:hypothetical protein GbCGDNIH6_8310 [Granulibacter bethesdensis]|nr:hypothetical protein GbCGDNIH6_8310 [Granulibacter bethesdensis]
MANPANRAAVQKCVAALPNIFSSSRAVDQEAARRNMLQNSRRNIVISI